MNEPQLLKPHEMAAILRVPVSWIYRQNMLKGPDSIPRIKIGKYVLYEKDKVIGWLRQKNIMRNE
mgnify:CR=1 FL=1